MEGVIWKRRRRRGFVGAPSLSPLVFFCLIFYFKTVVYFILLYLYKQHGLFLEYLNFLMSLCTYELDLLFILLYCNFIWTITDRMRIRLATTTNMKKEHGTLLSRVHSRLCWYKKNDRICQRLCRIHDLTTVGRFVCSKSRHSDKREFKAVLRHLTFFTVSFMNFELWFYFSFHAYI